MIPTMKSLNAAASRFRPSSKSRPKPVFDGEKPASSMNSASSMASCLATGGGAILAPENRVHLKSRGTVVYLRCQPKELFLRTRHDKNRPLLQTDDPLTKLKELYAARHALYMETADIVLDSGRQSAHALVRRLESNLALAAIGSSKHERPPKAVGLPVVSPTYAACAAVRDQ
jgi:hypothetical protein